MGMENNNKSLVDVSTSNDKWSVIKVMCVGMSFSRHEVLRIKQHVVRLLVQELLWLSEGWFTVWTRESSLGAEEIKYVVLGGVRCNDASEVKAIEQSLLSGLSSCNCFPLGVWWSQPCEDWRQMLDERLWSVVKDKEVLSMQGWIEDIGQWQRTWEAFNVKQKQADEWLDRKEWSGEEWESMEALVDEFKEEHYEVMEFAKEMGCQLSDEGMRKWKDRGLKLRLKLRERIENGVKDDMKFEWRKACDVWWAKLFGVDEEEYVRQREKEFRGVKEYVQIEG